MKGNSSPTHQPQLRVRGKDRVSFKGRRVIRCRETSTEPKLLSPCVVLCLLNHFDAIFRRDFQFGVSFKRAASLLVVRKRVSFNQRLDFEPAIAFTSLQIDMACHFWFTYIVGFPWSAVYFNNILIA